MEPVEGLLAYGIACGMSSSADKFICSVLKEARETRNIEERERLWAEADLALPTTISAAEAGLQHRQHTEHGSTWLNVQPLHFPLRSVHLKSLRRNQRRGDPNPNASMPRTATLERPKTHRPIEAAVLCKTPFLERNGDNHHCLGNPRWSSPPAIPSRQRAQEVVDDIERVKAESILAEYQRQSAHKALHDIQSRREAIERLELGKDFAGAESIRREIAKCNHAEYVGQ